MSIRIHRARIEDVPAIEHFICLAYQELSPRWAGNSLTCIRATALSKRDCLLHQSAAWLGGLGAWGVGQIRSPIDQCHSQRLVEIRDRNEEPVDSVNFAFSKKYGSGSEKIWEAIAQSRFIRP
jgi:hypothetical protein